LAELCARAPRLISVHGLRVAGDMVVDGVIPRAVLRPLSLSRPSRALPWRQRESGSWPQVIVEEAPGLDEKRKRAPCMAKGLKNRP
jgi:hypothetical protein